MSGGHLRFGVALKDTQGGRGRQGVSADKPFGAWQRFLAWDDFLRLGRSAGVYPRRILAGAVANGRRA